MSDKQKWPYAEAHRIAVLMRDTLAPFCEIITIAGSIRREKSEVGDIELLYVPKVTQVADGLFDTKAQDLAEAEIQRMLDAHILVTRPNKLGGRTWGIKNKLGIHVASGIPLDLFATTTENWWVSLVIRTGSKETNLRLTTGAQARSRSLNAYGAGVTDIRTGKVTPAFSEKSVFDLCGVPFLLPNKR